MNISVRLRFSKHEIEAISSSLMKFERMRSVPGLVVIGAITLIALFTLPVVAVVAACAGFVVMGVLTLTWFRTARMAANSALAFRTPSVVEVSDRGIVVTRDTEKSEVAWKEVLRATKTKAGWIFVSRKPRSAVLLPVRVLTDAEVGQLTTLLSTWSARRYRRSPW